MDEGLISSFPVRSRDQHLEVVHGLELDAFSRSKIDATVAELREERAMVSDLIKHT